MSKTQRIKTAPRDGTVVFIITESRVGFPASFHTGFVDDEDNEIGGWCAEDEDDAPSCWTDGVCWATNDDGKPSDPPVSWMP